MLARAQPLEPAADDQGGEGRAAVDMLSAEECVVNRQRMLRAVPRRHEARVWRRQRPRTVSVCNVQLCGSCDMSRESCQLVAPLRGNQ